MHVLKSIEPFWSLVQEGRKTFEVRVNDRDFKEGDHVVFRQWFRDTHTGGKFSRPFEIGYVVHGPAWGIRPDSCVFGLKEIANEEVRYAIQDVCLTVVHEEMNREEFISNALSARPLPEVSATGNTLCRGADGTLFEYLPDCNAKPSNVIREANRQVFHFAAAMHASKGQMYGKHPYWYHLALVRMFLKKFGFNDFVLMQAAAGHDLLEDTCLSKDDLLRYHFHPEAVKLIQAVTDEPGPNRKARKAKTYPKICRNPLAKAVKLADRIANVYFAAITNNKYLQMYRDEMPEFREGLGQRVDYIEWREEDRICDMWGYLEALLA